MGLHQGKELIKESSTLSSLTMDIPGNQSLGKELQAAKIKIDGLMNRQGCTWWGVAVALCGNQHDVVACCRLKDASDDNLEVLRGSVTECLGGVEMVKVQAKAVASQLKKKTAT